MKIGIPKEILEGETRVALIPDTVRQLIRSGFTVTVEKGAGEAASASDQDYEKSGASIAEDINSLYEKSELILKVNPPMDYKDSTNEIDQMNEGTVLISILWPLFNLDRVERLKKRKVTAFAMDQIPRISRSQSMDVLSSMSSIAGYKAALMGANSLDKFLPMMMTAAGTVAPARVFVIGAGVAGLQAIATARRLGAVVEAYDTRPVVKEQVESLGARFIQMELDTSDAEDKGGYAKELGEKFYKRQRMFMTKHLSSSDIVVTTALIPGRPAPKLITEEMVKSMRTGSVIVDLAAEQGGNCELTEPGQAVKREGVNILGYLNIPAMVSVHASQMYSKNISNFLLHLWRDNSLEFDMEDEITRGTLITKDGEVMHEATIKIFQKEST